MPKYKLEIKQVVDYPRCRIYRQFIQTLVEDRNIRTSGGSGLFYYTILCCYTNFKISYRCIDGINYTVYPEEWICSIKELSKWFRTKFHHQAISILEKLQKQHLISYLTLNRGKVIKYKIRNWKKYNTLLDHNCPYQNETGFIFIPVSVAVELISSTACSEMDIVLDLWISAIYNDGQVLGSETGPVVYLRNGTGNPLVTYAKLAARWGISKSTVSRILKNLEKIGYLSLKPLPGHSGSVIYLRNYLSTMFQISDIMIDKEEIAMELNIKLDCLKENESEETFPRGQITIADGLTDISKTHMAFIIHKIAEILTAQGISCFGCSKTRYKLYPMPNIRSKDIIPGRWGFRERIGLRVVCGDGRAAYSFELTLIPYRDKLKEDKKDEIKK